MKIYQRIGKVVSRVSKLFFGIVMIMSTQHLYAGFDLVSSYPGSQVFSSTNQRHQTYTLISGRMSYIHDEPPAEEEGYKPEASKTIQGMVERKIFDHRKEDSALDVAKNMLAELDRKGFEILYQCSGTDCGDVAGWQLFLSEKIDGSKESQVYVLARHPDDKNGMWYLAFYVNEFSDIPRSVIDVINTSDVDFNNYVINVSHLDDLLNSQKSVRLKGVNFKFNSALLTDDSQQALDQVILLLNKNKKLRLEIAGHTDDIGDQAYNLDLSVRRANAVRKYILEKGSIEASRLIASGYGETKPIVENISLINRQKNRRVELKKID